MSQVPLSVVHYHPSPDAAAAAAAAAAAGQQQYMHPSSPSYGHPSIMSPLHVGVPALSGTEIESFRAWRAAEVKRVEREEAEAQKCGAKLRAFADEHKILTMAVQFVVSVVVAFVLGYYSLKGEVDDAKQQATILTLQLNAQQGQVAAVALNVNALQAPVAELVTLVTTLNVQKLQDDLTRAQATQTSMLATNVVLQSALVNATSEFRQVSARALEDYATLEAALDQNAVLQDITNLQSSVSVLSIPRSGIRVSTNVEQRIQPSGGVNQFTQLSWSTVDFRRGSNLVWDPSLPNVIHILAAGWYHIGVSLWTYNDIGVNMWISVDAQLNGDCRPGLPPSAAASSPIVLQMNQDAGLVNIFEATQPYYVSAPAYICVVGVSVHINLVPGFRSQLFVTEI